MKKYNRKKPLVSPMKFVVSAFYAVIATAIIRCLSKGKNYWIIICGCIFVSLLITCLFFALSVGHKYVYGNTAIELFYFKIKYSEIKYNEFSCICISNASYNNGYGYGVYGNIPMKYKIKGKTGPEMIIYPFLTLHKPDYPIQKIKATMNSRDLFMHDSQNIFCLGICWYDSLMELLSYMKTRVYVLEDVYLNFRESLDDIFIQHEDDLNRFYIVTDHVIEYKKYLENVSN